MCCAKPWAFFVIRACVIGTLMVLLTCLIVILFSPFVAVVVSEESQYLVGFVARKDLAAAIENASHHIVDSDPDEASVFFTEVVPAIPSPSDGIKIVESYRQAGFQIEARSISSVSRCFFASLSTSSTVRPIVETHLIF